MSKDEESSPLKKVATAAKALRDISEVLTQAYKAVAKKIRPDYQACAADFRTVAMDVAGFARNLVEFLAPYYHFSFYKNENLIRKQLEELFARFRSKKVREWVSQVKFHCGEIDSYYSGNCEKWIKNSYGHYVARRKQQKVEKVLKQLTTIDAALVGTLTEKIMKPLEEFINDADQALTTSGDVDEARKAHEIFRAKVGPVFGTVERTLEALDEAVTRFSKVAK